MKGCSSLSTISSTSVQVTDFLLLWTSQANKACFRREREANSKPLEDPTMGTPQPHRNLGCVFCEVFPTALWWQLGRTRGKRTKDSFRLKCQEMMLDFKKPFIREKLKLIKEQYNMSPCIFIQLRQCINS